MYTQVSFQPLFVSFATAAQYPLRFGRRYILAGEMSAEKNTAGGGAKYRIAEVA
jgi:hypothetical protein